MNNNDFIEMKLKQGTTGNFIESFLIRLTDGEQIAIKNSLNMYERYVIIKSILIRGMDNLIQEIKE
jgi:hypothetical protein